MEKHITWRTYPLEQHICYKYIPWRTHPLGATHPFPRSSPAIPARLLLLWEASRGNLIFIFPQVSVPAARLPQSPAGLCRPPGLCRPSGPAAMPGPGPAPPPPFRGAPPVPAAGCGAMEDADYFEGSAAEWGSEADGAAVSARGSVERGGRSPPGVSGSNPWA